MSYIRRLTPCLVLAACGGPTAPPAPSTAGLPESVAVFEARTGATVSYPALLARLAGADFVLLGELHDNPTHHQVRGLLISASTARPPAVVFEQLAAAEASIPVPSPGTSIESWLDTNGFDRKAWKWPLHAPAVHAAIASGRSVWGSGVSREALRSVVKDGARSAPEPLWRLMEATPLDSAGQAAMDHELIVGHCNQLPESMIPGMRAAQEVRDAAMTRALLSAGADGPAWLIAGNGHVRSDVAVPRLLRGSAPSRSVLVVGLLESGPGSRLPDFEPGRYDLVIVTPPATREDPCARMGR